MPDERRMPEVTPCPNCGGRTLYASPEIGSGGGQAPDYLPGLSPGLFKSAKLTLVVCRDCGLARHFVSPQARAKLGESKKWQVLVPSDRGGFR